MGCRILSAVNTVDWYFGRDGPCFYAKLEMNLRNMKSCSLDAIAKFCILSTFVCTFRKIW